MVQMLPLEQADIEIMIAGLREITPPTQRVTRMIELPEQIRDRAMAGQGGPHLGPVRQIGSRPADPDR